MNNKYFWISGIIAFVIILLIGNYSEYSYLIAGLWLGFWIGIEYKDWKKK